MAIAQQPPDRSLTDLLSQEDFERLRALFDAALRYMEENRPNRVAAWGFVTNVLGPREVERVHAALCANELLGRGALEWG